MLRNLLAPLSVCALLSAPTALASGPDLTLTRSTYQSCLTAAADPAAVISITHHQTSLLAATSDLSAVYASLASLASPDGVTVTANGPGTQALAQAQACIDNAVSSIGGARLHQLRPDLRHAAHLYVQGQATFSTFELVAEHRVLTLFPDGDPDPACSALVHLTTYPLDNGDLATAVVVLDGGTLKKETTIDQCDWEGDDSRTAPKKKKCSPTREHPDDAEAYCTCRYDNSENGCATLSSSKVETIGSAAGEGYF